MSVSPSTATCLSAFAVVLQVCQLSYVQYRFAHISLLLWFGRCFDFFFGALPFRLQWGHVSLRVHLGLEEFVVHFLFWKGELFWHSIIIHTRFRGHWPGPCRNSTIRPLVMTGWSRAQYLIDLLFDPFLWLLPIFVKFPLLSSCCNSWKWTLFEKYLVPTTSHDMSTFGNINFTLDLRQISVQNGFADIFRLLDMFDFDSAIVCFKLWFQSFVHLLFILLLWFLLNLIKFIITR